MFNHAPHNYVCPLCLIVNGQDNPGHFAKVSDIFYKDENITAFVGGKFWAKNKGIPIIIPNTHIENIYDIDLEIGHKIFDFSKELAMAVKQLYECDGITIRQHNEPAGNQDVWHYHVHVTPRYEGDELYLRDNEKYWVEVGEREPYVKKLREYFQNE